MSLFSLLCQLVHLNLSKEAHSCLLSQLLEHEITQMARFETSLLLQLFLKFCSSRGMRESYFLLDKIANITVWYFDFARVDYQALRAVVGQYMCSTVWAFYMHQGEFGIVEVRERKHFYFHCISKLMLATVVDLSLSLFKARTKQAIAEAKMMRGNRTVLLSRDFSFL